MTLPVRDFKKAKDFYTKVLKHVGYEPNMEFDEACGFKEGRDTSFWISQADEIAPIHVAFEAKDKESVEKFHETACREGAKDNGGPGYRTEYWPGYYAAFVYDADGHNIEAVWYDYSKAPE